MRMKNKGILIIISVFVGLIWGGSKFYFTESDK